MVGGEYTGQGERFRGSNATMTLAGPPSCSPAPGALASSADSLVLARDALRVSLPVSQRPSLPYTGPEALDTVWSLHQGGPVRSRLGTGPKRQAISLAPHILAPPCSSRPMSTQRIMSGSLECLHVGPLPTPKLPCRTLPTSLLSLNTKALVYSFSSSVALDGYLG